MIKAEKGFAAEQTSFVRTNALELDSIRDKQLLSWAQTGDRRDSAEGSEGNVARHRQYRPESIRRGCTGGLGALAMVLDTGEVICGRSMLTAFAPHFLPE